MTFLVEIDEKTAHIDREKIRDKGKDLAARYAQGTPFPHIVIDDFLPAPLLEMCLEQFDASRAGDAFDRAQERYKHQYSPDTLSERARNLFYSLNSQPFVRVLENITGIKGLIPDPYFMGGGFHEIETGGHLSIHADFNHHKLMNLERRINVLIYLNEGWKEEWGGTLELWDTKMKECRVSVTPEFGRCVIFNTNSDSYHGNPHPVNHPDGLSRKSIALYYYTATWDGNKRSHDTQFRVRKGTDDQIDWTIRKNELIDDFLPPVLKRQWAKMKARVRSLFPAR